MSNIWDIADHVEKHPDDYDQRWRLVKKLYSAWEYDQALEHLLLLKKEWEPRVNLSRYLAAVFYRLGRHEEAARELEEALERWPGEQGLREQLTRVYEAAGETAKARAAWEQLIETCPDHPLAKKALSRLDKKEKKQAKSAAGQNALKAAFFTASTACPHCGASNVDGTARCWNCGWALGEDPLEDLGPGGGGGQAVMLSPETVGMVGVGAVVVLLLLGGFLTLRMAGAFGPPEETDVIHTLGELYTRQIVFSRAVTGGAVLLFWVAAMHIALRLVGQAKSIPAMLVNLTALLMGSLAYTASFLPQPMTVLALLLPMLLSLVIILSTFRLEPGRALAAWAVQFLMVLVFAGAVFTFSESYRLGEPLNIFREIRAVAAFASGQGGEGETAGTLLPENKAPMRQRMVFRSTGSAWLDRRAGPVLFTVLANDEKNNLRFQINDDKGAQVFDYMEGRLHRRIFEVVPEKEYTVMVNGDPGTPAQVVVEGLFRPEFLP